ncbi:hypothetical protein GCM10023208_08240 [Erythrobacter westpacificensis]|uniref:Uncharacterized protein n=1 Tax=Erythrobacter westpacificensis TaxID=1055231 RepID=A0ABP9K264_9SPHN
MTATASLRPEPSLGEILGEALRTAPLVDDFTFRGAQVLARDLAERLGVLEGDVFNALCTIPDSMLPLLRSPDGWAVLASFIAADFGTALNSFAPSIH